MSEFNALNRFDPLPKAKELADSKGICEAIRFLEYYSDYDHVRQDKEITAYYNELKQQRESYLFRGGDLVSGLIWGKGDCMESLVSATVSDFLLIGDVRDLVGEAAKKYHGEPADEFTMSLAAIGILSEGASLGAVGLPVKVTSSLLKTAKKMGKISASLEKSLVRIMRRSIETKNLSHLRPVADSIYNISRTKNIKVQDVFAALSRSRSVDDIRKMEKVVETYGGKTGKFLSLGGDTPLRMLSRFPNEKRATEAMEAALGYGANGSRLLEKTGPAKFLKYITITKYGARTVRSAWNARITSLLAKAAAMLPEWSLLFAAAVSGLIALGIPLYRISKFLGWRPAFNQAP